MLARRAQTTRLRRAVPSALILSVLALAAPAAASAACPRANVKLTRHNAPTVKRSTLCLLNAERARYGLRPLHATGMLARPANRHSRDMVRRRYFAHGAYLSRLRPYVSRSRRWRVGENLAWGGGASATPKAIVNMWMHSPPHRANILTGAFREIGFGVVAGTPAGVAGGTWTTDFGMRRG